ncbi:hypothetical protein [Anaplasma phagocytophilum]|uniref:hypothetical protein n=1 Tax=Anaplasma phagocytophilum TaxID=948 RepID=UPI0007DF1902|nr:hypothetical protein [Anaplasma phagocytophilum]SBO31738.1 hypothetical protein ANAPC2_00777 [Anaplasma phagocytophilum]SBO33332.1 hypothetical protein ANAPC3_01184 [Anaplasma phagocytophilum]SBO33405.1 hypothetical protein ANAPC4_01142 [Anaplasma phagocytophilum]SCV65111.1 hypothetical protein ANAPC5_01055 [Anaplasma phagocytophilum]
MYSSSSVARLLTDNFIVFSVMVVLTVCEFFLSGITQSFTPRFDILFMIFMHSRYKVPGYFPLFCVGIMRDLLYFSTPGFSSVLYVLSNAALHTQQNKLEGFRGVLLSVAMVLILQWVMSGLINFKFASIIYLAKQIAVCSVLGVLLCRRKSATIVKQFL